MGQDVPQKVESSADPFLPRHAPAFSVGAFDGFARGDDFGAGGAKPVDQARKIARGALREARILLHPAKITDGSVNAGHDVA